MQRAHTHTFTRSDLIMYLCLKKKIGIVIQKNSQATETHSRRAGRCRYQREAAELRVGIGGGGLGGDVGGDERDAKSSKKAKKEEKTVRERTGSEEEGRLKTG